MKWMTKMRTINNSAKRNQIKIKKNKFGQYNLENDIIREFVHEIEISWKFGDIGTGNISAKNREIA